MKALLAIFALPLVACSFGGDDQGGVAPQGSGANRTYAVADFTTVELAGADDVDVRVGSAFSVRAEGDPAVLDQLRIERRGDALSVGRRKDSFSFGKNRTVKVFVTMPRMAGASLAGSGMMAIDRVEGGEFEGEIAGSGTLAIAAMAVDKAEFEVAGSGDVTASGTARELEVSIAGSGDVEAPRLVAGAARVSIAGSGGVRATVNGEARIDLMGSGDVDLGPGARCRTNKMGSGTVRCGG